jgi:hypothetical protein
MPPGKVKREFKIHLEWSHEGSVVVEAESREQAVKMVEDNIGQYTDEAMPGSSLVDWDVG